VGAGDVAGGDVSEPVSVRASFERFPATVKGAFIIRGEDPDPHQVVFREARVVAIGGAQAHPIAMAAATLDVAPRRDVFIPFEMAVTDMDPGWYELECELDVDGRPRTFPGGRRFSVAWPRATVRRGQVEVGRGIDLSGGATVKVEQIDCGGDSIKVHVRVTPPEPVTVRLSADGGRLPVLESDFDGSTGRGKVVAYPLLRAHSTLRIDVRAPSRAGQGTLDVRLP
jgi:hypothetical protein